MPSASASSARVRFSAPERFCRPGELTPGEVQANGLELVDEIAVTAGGVGLTLERSQLAAHLAEQVLKTQQVALGRLEPALGLLAAARGT